MIGIVIPALDPPPALIDLVAGLRRELPRQSRIIVVDDGSADRSLFRAVQEAHGVTVLHHPGNLGKGEALKTGFRHLLADQAITAIVTVDADGQHPAADAARVCARAASAPGALVLGARNIDHSSVPLRSAWGNKATRLVLKLVSGLLLKDCQTGLRAVPRRLAERCLDIRSSGYDFETTMLLTAKRMAIGIVEVDVATVYRDGNRTSHFRPIADSIGIFWVFFRFALSSLAAFWLDIGLFFVIHSYTDAILLSTYAARTASATFNFLVNRRLVFRDSGGRTLVREGAAYAALAIGLATASGVAVSALWQWTGWPPALVKIGVDAGLFIVSFTIQRQVIFRRARAPGALDA